MLDDDDAPDDWTGARDAHSLPTGRGTLHLSKRARYEGHMAAGERSGRGVLFVDEGDSSDEETDGGGPARVSTLRVRWQRDEPCGPGVFTEPDGASVHGQWAGGVLHGPVTEHHADGGLRFAGLYYNGERSGFGVEVRPNGGALAGCWVGGALHGLRCAYLYPCRQGGALVGEWRRGEMLRASYVEVAALPAAGGPPPHAYRGDSAVHPSTAAFLHAAGAAAASAFDPGLPSRKLASILADAEALSATLLPRPQPRAARYSQTPPDAEGCGPAAEPYEARRVEVLPSRIPHAGRGLFARRGLQPSEVAAFLFGNLLPCGHAEEAPPAPPGVPADWAVCLGDAWLVPRAAAPLEELESCPALSLGWRANHGGWRANCALEPFEHPASGAVSVCVRVLPGVTVAAGEELLVAYSHLPDLPDDLLPQWYKAVLDLRSEDGYYAHLRRSPPRTAFERPSAAEGRCSVRVLEHGPWRVLWVGTVEQGMTYHDTSAAAAAAAAPPLVDLVVGFDYQRTMVAAASALVGCYGAGRGVAWGERRPHGLLVGLGGGSCAAALHSLGCDVSVFEYDQTVIDAARAAHGVAFEVRPTAPIGGARRSDATGDGGARRPIVVHLADAAEAATAAPVDYVLLDAYDGRGNVPAHLQEASFVGQIARTLHSSGFVLANLWNGSEEARAACSRFSDQLRAAVGEVFTLRVEGHEQNAILLAVKQRSAGAPGSSLGDVQVKLELAAKAAAKTCPEGQLALCLRSCAATIGATVQV